MWELPERMRAFRQVLLRRVIPLAWTVDLGLDDPNFSAVQDALLPPGMPAGRTTPQGALSRKVWSDACAALGIAGQADGDPTLRRVCWGLE